MNAHEGIKNFVCSICGKAFAGRKHMQRHEKIHDDVKPVSCEVYIIPKYAQCWFNLHMRDGAIHYKLYLLKLRMAVDNIVFRIIKGAF